MTAEALAIPLLRENVLHFLGYRRRSVPAPRTEQALESAISEARQLIAPRGLRRIVPPECAARLGLPEGPGSCLGLGLVTIGSDLEKRVTELLGRGEDTHALLLDAAGSAAVEGAAEEMERRIRGDLGDLGDRGAGREAGPAPRFAARRVSPGYASWPITAQRALFEMLPREEIGVRLLPSCLMAPRKSISFAVWLDVREGRAAGRCATCEMTTCPYRDDADEPEGP